jgi:hypothetical protein
MNEFSLQLLTPPADLLAAATATADRADWGFRRLILFAVPLPMAMGFGIGIAHILGQPVADAAMVALYTFVGGFIGLTLSSRVIARRHARHFATSALRRQPLPVTLSDAGVTFTKREVPWPGIQGTTRWRDNTLLHFSAVDILVIPDRDLPAGLTPDDLAARIAEWRAAA